MKEEYRKQAKKYKKEKYRNDEEYKNKLLSYSRDYYQRNKIRIEARRKFKKKFNIPSRTYETGAFKIMFIELKEYQQMIVDYTLSGRCDEIHYKANKEDIRAKFLTPYLPGYNKDTRIRTKENYIQYLEFKKQFTDTNILVIIKEFSTTN